MAFLDGLFKMLGLKKGEDNVQGSMPQADSSMSVETPSESQQDSMSPTEEFSDEGSSDETQNMPGGGTTGGSEGGM